MIDTRDEREHAKRLFHQHFVVGQIMGGVAQVRIDAVDIGRLAATGTVVDEKAMGFENGERVTFCYIHTDIWRVRSKRNDHGHAVFLDEYEACIGS
jgi:hypothetical protein